MKMGRILIFRACLKSGKGAEAVERIFGEDANFKGVQQPGAFGFLAPPAERGEGIMERVNSETTSAINEPSHFPKAQCQPSSSMGIDGEGEKGGGFNWVFKRFRALRVTRSETGMRQ